MCVESFPKWNPNRVTRGKIGLSDIKIKMFALRNSSSAFIKRKDVRNYIFSKYGCKCYLCGSTVNLQIDHVHSVYSCARGNYPVEKLNTEENLRPICAKCNAKKAP